MKINVGISPCPNDVFIFAGLILGRIQTPREWDFHFEDVESLNNKARAGDGDLLKISYANALNCPDYRLLTCGGALGRKCGPLLLTGGEAWNPEKEVLIPGEHTTANFLLDFWAGKTLQKRFLPFNDLYGELKLNSRAQGVVIHEKRFTYAQDGLNLVQDLGEHWEISTGHRIPLGALVYRAQSGLKAEEIETAVRTSLDWAYAHEPDALELCARLAEDMRPEVMRAHIALYVNEFTRALGFEGKAAVDFFLANLSNRAGMRS